MKEVEWHHRHDGHEFEQRSGDSEGQGILACCSPWGCRVKHTEQHQHQTLKTGIQVLVPKY